MDGGGDNKWETPMMCERPAGEDAMVEMVPPSGDAMLEMSW